MVIVRDTSRKTAGLLALRANRLKAANKTFRTPGSRGDQQRVLSLKWL